MIEGLQFNLCKLSQLRSRLTGAEPNAKSIKIIYLGSNHLEITGVDSICRPSAPDFLLRLHSKKGLRYEVSQPAEVPYQLLIRQV